ncbi:MAG: hypothetical protein AAF657_13830 [Acidobacteriota bacterium]
MSGTDSEGCGNGSAEHLTPTERFILDHVPTAYENGLVLQKWWQETSARDSFQKKLQLVYEPDELNHSFGFLDTVELQGKKTPICGEYQHDFYDQPKGPEGAALDLEWIQAQLREFALHYFTHISSLRAPEAFPQREGPRADPKFPLLSACSKDEDNRTDIGFFQLAYKDKASGEIHPFPKDQQANFVDVRQIGEKYDWILAKARMFQFDLTFYPLGEKVLPITLANPNEYLYLLFTPYFVKVEEGKKRTKKLPEGGEVEVVAEYGFGFSIVDNPSSKDVFTEGPQVFSTGIQFFNFELYENGQIWVEMTFMANQLTHIFQFPVDPIYWTLKAGEIAAEATRSRFLPFFQTVLDRLPLGPTIDPVFGSIRLIDALTGGIAGRDYCISLDSVQRFVLVKHEQVFSKMIADTSLTWRQVKDWLDADALPDWIRYGQGSA